jgi:methoxymalonate biosynthesis acyl carrier protein
MATSLTRSEMATPLTSVETAVRDFLLEEVLYDKNLTALGPDDALLETELLDSIAIMQIVAFCEQVFEITIPEEELLPDHFENIRLIGQLVERRLVPKPD